MKKEVVFTLKIAVCDECHADVERLEQALEQLASYVTDYDIYFGAAELLKYRSRQNKIYHIYILETEITGMSGLELAREIRKEDGKALFVFLTCHLQYVMDVFELVTFDYIEKPITVEKLEHMLKKAIHYLKLARQDFVFQFRKKYFRVNCEDILYIEKKGRQAVIHTNLRIYKTNMNTEALWKQLDSQIFVQIHLSYIVNLEHVRAIDGDDVILDSDRRLVIARSRKQELKAKYLAFVDRL